MWEDREGTGRIVEEGRPEGGQKDRKKTERGQKEARGRPEGGQRKAGESPDVGQREDIQGREEDCEMTAR